MAEQKDSHTRQSVNSVSKQRPLLPTNKLLYEKLSGELQNSLAESKKCIDRVLEMRAKCAELVLDVSSLNNPELLMKILKCDEMTSKWKGPTLHEETQVTIPTEDK